MKIDSLPLAHTTAAIKLPFWQRTSPLFDLAGLFWLLPVWWVLGVEQFIWPFGLALIALKIWFLRKPDAIAVGLPRGTGRGYNRLNRDILREGWRGLSSPAKWMLVFLAVHLISGLFIIETFRYFTFARNFSTYVTAFLILIVVPACIRSEQDVRKLLSALVGAMLIAGVLGLAGVLQLWQPEFDSVLGWFLPDSLAQTDYISGIVHRRTGTMNWFIGLEWFYRLKTFFLFPPLYASALVIVIPIALCLWEQAEKRVTRWLLGLVILLLCINLFYTTGRTAIAGFLVGGGYFLLTATRWRKGLQKLFVGIVIVGAVLTLLASALGTDLVREALYARGSGSIEDREVIYDATLKGWAERPVFGWGTERDFNGFRYPAGSHSSYLGVLYKQGLVGLVVFLGLWLSVWRHTAPLPQLSATSPEARRYQRLLQYGRWVILAALVNSITEVLDLDATNFAILWVVLGVFLSARALMARETNQSTTEQTVRDPQRVNLLGVNVSKITVPELHEYITRQIETAGHVCIPNVNVYCMNLAFELAYLRKWLNQWDIIFCDGAGVMVGARLLGETIPVRITYADWMWQLGAFCAAHEYTLFFVGAEPGVAQKAAERMMHRFPGLRIIGTQHGYFNRTSGHPENDAVIEQINLARPDILVTGLGMPLQETWLMDNWDRIQARVALTGGAAFDYVSGELRRPPRWMTANGMEWLGRMFIEPSRLWYRYLVGNPRFLWRVLLQKWGRMQPDQDLAKRYQQNPPRY